MTTAAPPGGGPAAVVVASTQPATPAAPSDPNLPIVPAVPATPPAAPPDPNVALSLEPITPPAPAAPAAPSNEAIDFGDNGLNIAADYFVNTLGLDLDGRELSEAAKGNFHLLEAKLEVLGDKAKGSGPMLKLARESIERVATASKAKAAATVTAVHTAVGGEANWKAVQQWARTNLPANELAEASAALNAGGMVATAVAQSLLARAAANPHVTVQGQPITNGTPVSDALVGSSPLSKEQYRSEYRKLIVECGGIAAAQKSPKLAQLNARYVR